MDALRKGLDDALEDDVATFGGENARLRDFDHRPEVDLEIDDPRHGRTAIVVRDAQVLAHLGAHHPVQVQYGTLNH